MPNVLNILKDSKNFDVLFEDGGFRCFAARHWNCNSKGGETKKSGDDGGELHDSEVWGMGDGMKVALHG